MTQASSYLPRHILAVSWLDNYPAQVISEPCLTLHVPSSKPPLPVLPSNSLPIVHMRRPSFCYLRQKSRGPFPTELPDSTAPFPLAVPFPTYIGGSRFLIRVRLLFAIKFFKSL
ncbi:hypothetical protein ATANTOWER_020094 [Ataeniobius toweri]|uniref:Uncharacterized protein n=1 Tax=Ataeniobius toweri TaxID=208326 RepID=A0ABU7AGM6_9TELE|nr:hypothetical protein [Ataeniobius toweri]